MDALGLEVDHSVTMAPEMGDRIATVASARTQFQISTAAMIWARFTCEEQTRHFDYIFAPRCLTFDCDFGITDAEISYILVKCGIHLSYTVFKLVGVTTVIVADPVTRHSRARRMGSDNVTHVMTS